MQIAQRTKQLIPVVIAVLSCTAIGQTTKIDPALASLIATERAFARNCVERGVRDSFLAFFADNAICFWPHPVIARQELLKQPAPATRPPRTLNWEPQSGGISRAGELGFSTGPTLTTDDTQNNKPLRYGYYFSIWRKQADGTWKVELDIGIQTPPAGPLPAPSLRTPAQAAAKNHQPYPNDGQRVLLEMERTFSPAPNMSEAFLKLLSDDAELNHEGHFPILGRGAIHKYLTEQKFNLCWEPIKAVVASSNDFAYTYGKYLRQEAVIKKGYYVHVWQRDAQGQWKMSVEVLGAPLAEKE